MGKIEVVINLDTKKLKRLDDEANKALREVAPRVLAKLGRQSVTAAGIASLSFAKQYMERMNG